MSSGGLEEREKTYLLDAYSHLQTPCKGSDTALRLTLLCTFISVLQDSTALKKLEEWGLDLDVLKTKHLLPAAWPTITSEEWRGQESSSFLTALDALNVLDKETIAPAAQSLLNTSNYLLENGLQGAGWDMRIFLAKHCPETLDSPFTIRLPPLNEADETSTTAISKASLMEYVDMAVRDADEDQKLEYLQQLVKENERPRPFEHLVFIDRLIHHVKGRFHHRQRLSSRVYAKYLNQLGSRPAQVPPEAKFGLAQVHSTLCKELRETQIGVQFLRISGIIHTLLEEKAPSMGQWNIDLTLGTVSVLCSASATYPATSLLNTAPKTYTSLCRFVEAVIRHHRIRLDGHMPVVIDALQALLRTLLHRPADPKSNDTLKSHAKLYSRLLILLCEPTEASAAAASYSISRSSKTNGSTGALDSEKDKARGYVGQFMYYIVMQYIKLQLEREAPLPHAAREALDTGMFSILRATTDESMKIMNDAMDGSGRAVFREMWKQFQRVGKWSGV